MGGFASKKTVLVTGSTDGIGKETAVQLAKAGARVVIHGRSPIKVQSTAEEVRERTGSSVLGTIEADLSTVAAARLLAEQVKQNFPDIQILINNAGTFSPALRTTDDQLEETFAVNYMAPFVLTLGLLDLLRANRPSRIINVASTLHRGAELDPEDPDSQESPYNPYRSYGSSKLALALFSYELSQRLLTLGETHVTVNFLHPGGVITKLLLAGFGQGGIPVEHGAQTSVYLADAPELAGVTGKYFSRMREAFPDPRVFQDHELRKRLWESSEKIASGIGRARTHQPRRSSLDQKRRVG